MRDRETMSKAGGIGCFTLPNRFFHRAGISGAAEHEQLVDRLLDGFFFGRRVGIDNDQLRLKQRRIVPRRKFLQQGGDLGSRCAS